MSNSVLDSKERYSQFIDFYKKNSFNSCLSTIKVMINDNEKVNAPQVYNKILTKS